ncbi:MAG: DegT/DnrJ/EryC1/StrS family aminotransferase [Gammaproteobacteria bacterium]|jgi:dTDP-4-amino-4,6-dideoxygalactose transaminase
MNDTRKVPFFNYKFFHQQYGEELLSIMNDVLKRGAFILQNDLLEFEQQFAQYLGVKYAVGVANCTDGLLMACRCADIAAGDEVILPSNTFVATAAAVHRTGAKPVLIECGEDHLMLPDAIEAAITKKTKAIMPVQLNGRVCNMDQIMQVAKKHNLFVIEDAAQALGAKLDGKMAGTFGKAAAFSFYPAKVLGCFGDGGMVVTNEAEIAEKCLLQRDHGRNHEGEVVVWGGNSRLDNLQAAILSFFLARFDEVIAKRRHIASLYNDRLCNIQELLLPPAPSINSDHFDVFQNYEIEAENRDALQDYLKSVGIGTLRQWGGKAIHQFDQLGFDVHLPLTDRMISRALMLPLNMSLTDEDVEYVCAHVQKFYHK